MLPKISFYTTFNAIQLSKIGLRIESKDSALISSLYYTRSYYLWFDVSTQ